ncbi:MAG: N-formylglutamate amidohydrolase [Nitrosopumilus sp.]|nr:N-formylglutamate amidohydrolase [Nitrosopumilus sp.]MDH3854923.1 N-formylglutamate amidohydrolase [Nitrosopumilus sp.]
MSKLPILLSIPHGGTRKPAELEGHLSITNKDLFDDSDPFVMELYDLGDKVQRVIKTDIARAFVDLNRSLQDMPPDNPDGLIKSKTCYDKPIYANGKEPDDSLKTMLIELYYKPYHQAIQESIDELDLQLCLDCHSMASTAPYFSPDKTQSKRPMFCISNNDGQTSSQEMIELLSNSISEAYSVDRNEISLNDPFHGGHIIKTYGNNPVPWIQVEMNRDLYLSKEWFDHETLQIDKERLQVLNQMFENMLTKFCSDCFKGR